MAVVAWPRRASAKTVALPLSLAPELEKVGGWEVLEIKGKKVLLIRDTSTTVRATQPLCTHKMTRLTYNIKDRIIVCPEHGSRFSLAGEVRKGPAEAPLRVYRTKLDLEKKRLLIKL
jgi:Rieske Fe-S protein